MSETHGSDLTLEWKPAGRNGMVTVTAKLLGEPLAVETLDLTKGKARERFAASVCDGRPGIDRTAVESELLRLAAERAEPTEGSPPDLADQPEIDVSRIIRPERFILPEVSGIAIPKLTAVGDRVVGRWQWYLRWADGTREERGLGTMLNLPGGDRLWVNPEPGEPSATMPPGWSAEARRRWLGGEPAPSPSKVFHAICKAIAFFLELPNDEAAGITAMLTTWTILSYVYPAWPAVPYLYAGGPAGSGKTCLFNVLARLVFRPLSSSSMTAASLFRTLHARGGVLLLDEAEQLRDTKSPEVGDLRTMLLAGYKRGGSATRLESVGDGFQTITYDVYCPKSLACISGLPAALASRAIPIMMFRAPPGSKKPLRRIDANPARWQVLRDALHAMALEHGPRWLELTRRSDVCPPMGGRDHELWQPLLAIASFIEETGARGLVRLLQEHALATIDATRDDQTPDHDETLLRILAAAIKDSARLTPGEILDLAKEDDAEGFRRWSPRGVAEHLKRYGLKTHKTVGAKRYSQVTLEDLRQIERNYGIDLGLQDS